VNKPVGFYGPIAPPVPNAPSSECPKLRSQHHAAPPVQLQYPGERHAAAAVPLPESPYGQTSKCIFSVRFVGIESNFFYNTQETQTQNMMDQNFEIEFCDFCEFFEIFKKASRGLLRPIWTIMVAAKLDHC